MIAGQALGMLKNWLYEPKKEVPKEEPKKQEKQKPSAPARTSNSTNITNNIPPVAASGTAQPILMNASMIPPMPSQKNPVSFPELLSMLDAVMAKGGTGKDTTLPGFDISDLEGEKSKIDALISGGLPYDVRPMAAYMDTVFGTNSYQKTPNQRSEFLNEVEQFKKLHTDSAALQQVKGQARLEQYKALLKSGPGGISPMDMTKMLENLSDATNGSTPEMRDQWRAQWDVVKGNTDEQRRVDERNRQLYTERLKIQDDIAKEFQNAPFTKNYENVRMAADTTRATIAQPNVSGAFAYAAVIKFIKTLDSQSTVMYNEAQGFYDSTGIFQKMLQYPNQIFDGGKLGPTQIRDMMNMLAHFQSIAKESYERGKQTFDARAANAGFNPNAVTGPTDQAMKDPTQWIKYEGVDKNGKPLPKQLRTTAEGQAEFLRKMEAAGIRVKPVGTSNVRK